MVLTRIGEPLCMDAACGDGEEEEQEEWEERTKTRRSEGRSVPHDGDTREVRAHWTQLRWRHCTRADASSGPGWRRRRDVESRMQREARDENRCASIRSDADPDSKVSGAHTTSTDRSTTHFPPSLVAPVALLARCSPAMGWVECARSAAAAGSGTDQTSHATRSRDQSLKENDSSERKKEVSRRKRGCEERINMYHTVCVLFFLLSFHLPLCHPSPAQAPAHI